MSERDHNYLKNNGYQESAELVRKRVRQSRIKFGAGRVKRLELRYPFVSTRSDRHETQVT